MENSYRWGIVGLGRIAHAFARDLALFDNAALIAVGSRSRENADAFAAEHSAPHAFDSYEAVLSHPDVDIVYVATPHHQHAELSIAALRHGKHVLCEKPVAMNAAETAAIVEAAREADRFFMEALWTRFIPAVSEVIARIKRGDIGSLRHVQAEFSFVVEEEEGSRARDPAQGGGSLLDMGIYPLFLAYVTLGVPSAVQALMVPHETGVDEQMAVVLQYDGALATAYSGFASQSNMRATISGEQGRFVLHPIWHETEAYSILDNLDWEGKRVTRDRKGHGLYHEIEACHECLRTSQRECPQWTHADSLKLMNIMDQVRKAAGLIYPSETQ